MDDIDLFLSHGNSSAESGFSRRCRLCLNDKLRAAAIIVTCLLPVLGMCVILFSGCSITKRVLSLVCFLCCVVCGLFSIGLWTAILMRHLWNRGGTGTISSANSVGDNNDKKSPPLLLAFALSALVTSLGYAHAHLGDYGYLKEEYDENWGFLVKKDIAPVWVGEFGSDEDGESNTWFLHLLRYTEELDLGWSYWPLDGAKENIYEEESYGILKMDYLRYRDHPKLKLISPKLNITI